MTKKSYDEALIHRLVSRALPAHEMLLGIIKHNMPKPVKMTLGDMSTVATIAGCMAGLPRSRVLDITERGIDLTWQE